MTAARWTAGFPWVVAFQKATSGDKLACLGLADGYHVGLKTGHAKNNQDTKLVYMIVKYR